MRYTNYNKLKQKGDKGEIAFANFLHEQGYTCIEHIDDVYEKEGLSLSDWDIRAVDQDGVITTYEVKAQYDCHTWKTFNIEQVQSKKLAGIAKSKADVWVFVNDILGFGMIDASKLFSIHMKICKDPSVTQASYFNRTEKGDIKLWATKYKNTAYGFRLPISRLTWHDGKN